MNLLSGMYDGQSHIMYSHVTLVYRAFAVRWIRTSGSVLLLKFNISFLCFLQPVLTGISLELRDKFHLRILQDIQIVTIIISQYRLNKQSSFRLWQSILSITMHGWRYVAPIKGFTVNIKQRSSHQSQWDISWGMSKENVLNPFIRCYCNNRVTTISSKLIIFKFVFTRPLSISTGIIIVIPNFT